MSNGNFIKLYRQILDNPIVCKDGDHFAVWVYLLLQATHTERKHLFNGQRITLKAGQLTTGRKRLADKFNISESKVQRILKTFEIEQQIEQQTGNKNRLITVKNWSAYQSREQQIEQQLNNKRTTTEQQLNTEQEGKKERREEGKKKDTFALFWSAYPRKAAKGDAEKAFNKIKPDDELLKTMIDAIDAQSRSPDWIKDGGQFIPYPATWLNQKRWEDEISRASPQAQNSNPFLRGKV